MTRPNDTSKRTAQPNAKPPAKRATLRSEGVSGVKGAGRPQRDHSGDPGPESIRVRAYERYLARGGTHGRDLDDWLEAERDLKVSRRPAARRRAQDASPSSDNHDRPGAQPLQG